MCQSVSKQDRMNSVKTWGVEDHVHNQLKFALHPQGLQGQHNDLLRF